MRLKLFKKYFLTAAITILSSLTILLLILTFVLNDYVAKEHYSTLSMACEEVTDFIQNANDYENVTRSQIFGVIHTASMVSQSDIFICDTTGKVILCSCEDYNQNGNCLHTQKKISQNDIEEIPKTNSLTLSKLGIYDEAHYVVAVNIKDKNNKTYGTVFSTASISTIKEMVSTISKLYLFSAIIPLVVMCLVIYAITYKMTKPLKLMSEAARAMSNGDFSKRIPVTSDDEIGELSAAFNTMTNSLTSLEGMRKSFVANVSHELKTPMTTIAGFIDGILDGTIDTAKHKHYLEIVSDEVKRLSRLVESMLSMTKLESGEMAMRLEIFDLRELVFTTVISQEQRIESKHIEISGLDVLENISIEADKDLIHQVLYNLLDNAIKFTDDGGKIEFSLKGEADKTIFVLTNTGKGIPQKDINFIFERFYKVDKSRSASKNSSGIGLYIVKTIIKAHKGTIMVSSKENETTSFKVMLPYKQQI